MEKIKLLETLIKCISLVWDVISKLLLIVQLHIFRQWVQVWGCTDQITVSLSVFVLYVSLVMLQSDAGTSQSRTRTKRSWPQTYCVFNPPVPSCFSVSLWVSLTRRGKYETKPFLTLWFTYTNETDYNWSELIFFSSLDWGTIESEVLQVENWLICG